MCKWYIIYVDKDDMRSIRSIALWEKIVTYTLILVVVLNSIYPATTVVEGFHQKAACEEAGKRAISDLKGSIKEARSSYVKAPVTVAYTCVSLPT